MISSKKKVPAATVGVDIGNDSIKFAEAKYTKDGIVITGLGYTRLPENVLANELVVDPKGLGNAIKAMLTENGIKTRYCVSSVAGQSKVVVRVIEVPKMDDKELSESMKWEVERQVPFAINDLEMDYEKLDTPSPDPSGNTMEVLLAVAQRELVQSHVETIEAAGLRPKAIDVESLAAGRALIAVPDPNQPEEIVAIISIGSQNTEMGIFENGVLTFPSPPLGIAGDSFTREIAEALGITFEEAEIAKKEYAAVNLDGFSFDQGSVGANEPTSYDTAYTVDIPYSTPFDGDVVAEPIVEAAQLDDFGFDLSDTSGPSFDTAGPSFDLEETENTEPVAEPATEVEPLVDLGGDVVSADLSDILSEENVEPSTQEQAAPAFDMTDLDDNANPGQAVVPHEVKKAAESEMSQKVFQAISSVLVDFSNEIRRSIDYYNVRYSKMPSRIIISGGTAKIPNLDEFLHRELGIPVEVANPLKNFEHNLPGISSNYLKEMAPLFCVSIGLAIRDMVD